MIVLQDALLIICVIFLQYVVINVLPVPFANVDLFLVLSGVYAMRRTPVRAMVFVFVGVLLMEWIYPVAAVSGLKTMAALILCFLLTQVNRVLVLKGAMACLAVGIYAVLTELLTRVFALLVGTAAPATPVGHLAVLLLGSMLLACLVIGKFDVQ